MPIHHPHLIRPILPDERVLEVGPGAYPWPRADVLCDRFSRSDPEALSQDGFATRPTYNQPAIICERAGLPFKDAAFDYVVCSHVLEHVEPAELEQFINELVRVARGGYLEFPRYLLELQGDTQVHRWLMNVVDGEIRLLEKARVQPFVTLAATLIGNTYATLTRHSAGYQQVYREYGLLWVSGLEWRDRIAWRVVESWEELLAGDRSEDAIGRIAPREWEQARMSYRLRSAVRRRFGRRRDTAASGDAARPFPTWLPEVLRCPACGEAKMALEASTARCGACGAGFPVRDGEYLLGPAAGVSGVPR